MLARWGIRLMTSLGGIAAGLIIASAVVSGVSATASGIVIATGLFWIVHIIVTFIALRILVREPSIAMAGLLALASTIVSLFIVSLVVDDLSIRGAGAFIITTLILWATTVAGDVIGRSMIRSRRRGND